MTLLDDFERESEEIQSEDIDASMAIPIEPDSKEKEEPSVRGLLRRPGAILAPSRIRNIDGGFVA
jgi:hypothetical protein